MVTRIEISGTHNFREVAPGWVRPGVFYRSDALHRVNAEGRRALRGLGIGRVVDLRSDFDRRIGGRDRLRGVGAELVRYPIAAGGRTTDPRTIDLRGVYRTILGEHGMPLGLAIRAVAESQTPIVVHCTAGKDRTGLVAALSLIAVEVPLDAVVADYELTGQNLAGEWSDAMLRRLRRFRVEATPNVLEVITASPAPVLRETLDWIDAEYGGVLPYLAGIGVDAPVVEALRARLR